jgi:hypothetical protein
MQREFLTLRNELHKSKARLGEGDCIQGVNACRQIQVLLKSCLLDTVLCP